MKTNRYIEDILSQPASLRDALTHYPTIALDDLAKDIRTGRFDRIVITGMGASLFGAYPAWLDLARRGLPAWLVDTGELIHYSLDLITSRTLVWIISQSGYSAEVQALLERLAVKAPAAILGLTNDPDSPLGKRSLPLLLLYSGQEFTVSTRSYLNTLAVTQIATQLLAGDRRSTDQLVVDFKKTADALDRYLADWEAHVQRLIDTIMVPERLVILGRGPSMANVETGSLILKEAAKYQSEGMNAGQFRHGPLELADPRLSALVYEGSPETSDLSERLARDLSGHGARVYWLSPHKHGSLPTIPLPDAPDAGQILAEILPVQMLTISISYLTGMDPGIFRHSGKVTLTE